MTDEIPLLPDPPPALRDASSSTAVVPFVGAGASRLAGCPGWAEFAEAALRTLIGPGKFTYSQFEQVRGFTPRLKLSLALALAHERRSAIDFDGILHPAGWRENASGRRLYRSLSALSRTFVTTNHDRWLDEVLEPDLSAIATDQSPNLAPLRRRSVVYKVHDLTPDLLSRPDTAVHLHGSVLEPESLILTTEHYVNHYANDRGGKDPQRENRVLTFLEHLFAHKTALFIGYGLEELEILEYVILKSRRNLVADVREPRHFVLQGFFSHELEAYHTLKSYYLRECGLHLIPFSRDEKNYEQLIDVLEHFARTLPASNPMVLHKRQQMEAMLNDA